MVSLDIVEKEILDLEKKDTSYTVIERLAWLYTVRDHMISEKRSDPTGLFSGSEFCECCSNVPMDSLMAILSEHMEVLKVTYPREYAKILEKIQNL